MTMTMPSITGHFAMPQIVRLWSPRPTASPTAWARGPLTTRPTSTRAAMMTSPTVMSSTTGRSFQIGRPSSTW